MFEFPGISISFEDVTASPGGQPLFAGLSFNLSSQTVLWLQGANGIGKTTILRLAAGLSAPEKGRVNWQMDGQDVDAADICVFQAHRNALKAHLTAREDLDFWADIYGYTGDVRPIVKAVGLSDRENVQCQHLSAGQSRRLSIARLMISQKPLWIMDEPAAAMDSSGQNLIFDVVNTHIAKGGAALIASHDAARRFSGHTSLLTLETN